MKNTGTLERRRAGRKRRLSVRKHREHRPACSRSEIKAAVAHGFQRAAAGPPPRTGMLWSPSIDIEDGAIFSRPAPIADMSAEQRARAALYCVKAAELSARHGYVENIAGWIRAALLRGALAGTRAAVEGAIAYAFDLEPIVAPLGDEAEDRA